MTDPFDWLIQRRWRYVFGLLLCASIAVAVWCLTLLLDSRDAQIIGGFLVGSFVGAPMLQGALLLRHERRAWLRGQIRKAPQQ